MTEVVRTEAGGELAQFDPKAVRSNQVKRDALITALAKLQEWEKLDEAIDAKIKEQAEFVRWWDATVRPPRAITNALKSTDRGSIAAADAEAQTKIRHQQTSRWRKALRDEARYRARITLAAYRQANLVPPANHRAEGTGINEWFTPLQYIDAARSVMDGIDLDPATHADAQEAIGASRFYTKEDDGLTKHWQGRVWLNPPYAQPLIMQFVAKLVKEYSARRVTHAVLLTHAYTDTAWWHLAASVASRMCLTVGRIKFTDIDGDPCAPTQGQTFFYLGNDPDEFAAVFGEFGLVIRRA